MGKLVVSEFVTVDGVFEDPGGAGEFEHGGWAFRFERGEEGDRFKYDELMAADAQLLGRVTYEGFAAAWPTMEGTGAFGERMNAMPKYVVSSTLERADWNNSTIVDGTELDQRVAELKDAHEGDLLVAGSGRLVQGLADHGLIDEYRLMVFPVALGAGKRLFDGVSAPVAMELTETRPAGECLILIYKPKA